MSAAQTNKAPLISRWPALDEGGEVAAQLIFEHIGDREFASSADFQESFTQACLDIGLDRMPWGYYRRDAIGTAQDEGWLIVNDNDSITVSLPPEWAEAARRRLAVEAAGHTNS